MIDTPPPQKTILYIEDDLNSQRLVKRVLERYGFLVHVADDGLKGIEIAQREKPDIVLTDINLPSMDGHEITTRLRSLPQTAEVPIVALTANVSHFNRDLALAAGCSGFITKPIDIRKFPEQIQEYLGGHVEPISDSKRNEVLTIHAQRMVERLETKLHEIEQANQKLRELDRMKSNLIVLISHELRTPINLITGYTHLLDQFVDEETNAQKESYLSGLVRGLKEGVSRLSTLVSEVISISNIAGGMLDLNISHINIAEMLENILKGLDSARESRDLQIHLLNVDLPSIEGDEGQLKVVFKNLVGNAIKFTPDGGEIFIEGELLKQSVRISVRDTGIGIPVEQQSRIFEQFYSLNPIEYHTTSKHAFQGGGLGLGLAIAKGVVEAHGGRISVESPGKDENKLPGSTFHVYLPVQQNRRFN